MEIILRCEGEGEQRTRDKESMHSVLPAELACELVKPESGLLRIKLPHNPCTERSRLTALSLELLETPFGVQPARSCLTVSRLRLETCLGAGSNAAHRDALPLQKCCTRKGTAFRKLPDDMFESIPP
jgi:hypothetical protein